MHANLFFLAVVITTTFLKVLLEEVVIHALMYCMFTQLIACFALSLPIYEEAFCIQFSEHQEQIIDKYISEDRSLTMNYMKANFLEN
jgi:hypothetical protein